ncbi:MAG: anti-sigma factor family protein [Myxococcota bacterium]
MSELERRDDERLSAWIDGRMDEPERLGFESELERDPELGEALRGLSATVHHLRDLRPQRAPADFLSGVQSRIRRRTRGDWYASAMTRARFPYEAAFNVVLLGLLLATYLVAIPTPDPEPVPIDPAVFQVGESSTDAVGAVLGAYGPVGLVTGSDGPEALTWRLTLPIERLPDLRRELTLYPDAAVLGVPLPALEPRHVEVRVRVLKPAER